MFENCTSWKVVINVEDQYSIWPMNKELPLGWRALEKSGTKEECLDYIKEIWVDMRPRSLRELMDKKNSETSKQVG